MNTRDRLRKREVLQEYDNPEDNLYSWSLNVTDRVQDVLGGDIVEEAIWNYHSPLTEKEAVDSVIPLLDYLDQCIKERHGLSLHGSLLVSCANGRLIKFGYSKLEGICITLIEE